MMLIELSYNRVSWSITLRVICNTNLVTTRFTICCNVLGCCVMKNNTGLSIDRWMDGWIITTIVVYAVLHECIRVG